MRHARCHARCCHARCQAFRGCGTIARCTDESNATLGFGIFYWSINLGAFLFPLVLVPVLRDNIGYQWVIVASAIGTGAMLLPTLFLFREPPRGADETPVAAKTGLLQTVANAFEIIYSPIVLLFGWARRSIRGRVLVTGEPNLCQAESFEFRLDWGQRRAELALLRPDRIEADAGGLNAALGVVRWVGGLAPETLAAVRRAARQALGDPSGLARSILWLFLGLLFGIGWVVLRLAPGLRRAGGPIKALLVLGTVGSLGAFAWALPDLSLVARIVLSVIGLSATSLYAIESDDPARFRDHFKFLLMIFLYSGFWVLYFQMFDSVLWYVQAYVDPSSLNAFVNSIGAALGIEAHWRFDVEIVTVINAFTIILLQLVVSAIVKNTKALPTMVVGICMGTLGMAILAVSTGIWVLMTGIVIFSIGEMTAHPKFIANVGQTAPKARVAMYMGYLFLYGVIGSSIGAVLGAKLYVKFIDELDQPRSLWLIFAGIGLATVIGLLFYNALVARKPGSARVEAPGD